MSLRFAKVIVALATLIAWVQIVNAQETSALTSYTTCKFSDGLHVVDVTPLAPGVISREVDTDSGPRTIDMEEGLRVMFAYPATDFYANVKAESLPVANYPQLKQYLLENLQHLARGNQINAALKSPLNGFEAHGLDRERLEGGVLGIYLLFDDPEHVVTTIYFLNQEPQDRKFQTMDDYRTLRDRFLDSYTKCIRTNQKGAH